jgi:2'-5' RNA ligase
MRCFIALKLDDAIKDRLQAAQEVLKNIGGKVSWCSRQQMHLTLQFLGEVEDKKVPKIIEAMTAAVRDVTPFEFSVENIGAFPPKGSPRIIWAGISECPPLLKLQRRLEDALKPLGFKPEDRSFTPHLTLGRVRERPDLQKYQTILSENKNFSAGIQQTEKVILFSSDLKPTGAVYTALAEISLPK